MTGVIEMTPKSIAANVFDFEVAPTEIKLEIKEESLYYPPHLTPYIANIPLSITPTNKQQNGYIET